MANGNGSGAAPNPLIVLMGFLLFLLLAFAGVGLYSFITKKKKCADVKGVATFSTDGKCTAVDCSKGYSLDSTKGSCTACASPVPGATYDDNKCTFSACDSPWTYTAPVSPATVGTCGCSKTLSTDKLTCS
jgi:hypothetical protein